MELEQDSLSGGVGGGKYLVLIYNIISGTSKIYSTERVMDLDTMKQIIEHQDTPFTNPPIQVSCEAKRTGLRLGDLRVIHFCNFESQHIIITLGPIFLIGKGAP